MALLHSFVPPWAFSASMEASKRPESKGSWLAKKKPEVDEQEDVTNQTMSPGDRWNRKGKYVQSSFNYQRILRERCAPSRPQSAPSGARPGTAGSTRPGTAGSRRPGTAGSKRPQSAWSDATTGTTAAMSRDSPNPGEYVDVDEDDLAEGSALVSEPPKTKTKEVKVQESVVDKLSKNEQIEKKKQETERNKWLLMNRVRIQDEEYKKLATYQWQHPFTRSKCPFRSCLLPDRAKTHPTQVAHHGIKQSLEEDKATYAEKYNAEWGKEMEQLMEEVSPLAKHSMAGESMRKAWKTPTNKYSVRDVEGEQQDKFSRLEPKSNKATQGERRYAVHTLRQWFTAIDTEKKGLLSRRQMLNALWHHKELCDIFGKAAGLEQVERNAHSPLRKTMFQGLGDDVVQQYKQMGADDDDIEDIDDAGDDCADDKVNELKYIARILRDVDADGSGNLTWVELVDFFRRTGHLLEYETREGKRQNDATHYWMDHHASVNLGKRLIDPGSRSSAAKGEFETFGSLKGRGAEQRERDSVRRSTVWTMKPESSSPESRRTLINARGGFHMEDEDEAGELQSQPEAHSQSASSEVPDLQITRPDGSPRMTTFH